jgi:ferric-dicitrate binding protein FerR (iron transport regulator)
VNKGKRKTVNLSDGTIITMDAGSKLEYPVKFGKTRDVYLKGEAYFEVAKDSEHPFFVHVNNATVKVVGTKFNIRSWKENPRVTVTVVEGKVLLANAAEISAGVYLTRGKQGSVSSLGEVAKPIDVNPEKYIKWMHNEIYFKNAPLKEILAQLERWYGYKFNMDSEVADQTMTVHIRNVNVKEVIDIISKITKSRTVKDGKLISFIKKDKNIQ